MKNKLDSGEEFINFLNFFEPLFILFLPLMTKPSKIPYFVPAAGRSKFSRGKKKDYVANTTAVVHARLKNEMVNKIDEEASKMNINRRGVIEKALSEYFNK